ncbi:MAG: STAS domain-containing protein [Bacillota bacterium]|nr:STAS domain-containing protein [Bacillota bacterium]
MKHSITVSGNQATVLLMDKIFVHDASILRDDLIEIMEGGVTDVRIDLSGLKYIDCSGLGTLVAINKRTKKKKGSFVLAGAQGLPLDLIKRTRLDKVLAIK